MIQGAPGFAFGDHLNSAARQARADKHREARRGRIVQVAGEDMGNWVPFDLGRVVLLRLNELAVRKDGNPRLAAADVCNSDERAVKMSWHGLALLQAGRIDHLNEPYILCRVGERSRGRTDRAVANSN